LLGFKDFRGWYGRVEVKAMRIRSARSVKVRLINPEPKTGERLVIRSYRSGKWKPLGVRHHVPSDPTLLNLMRSLRDGKRTLMGLARRAAASDLVLAPLIDKWDALTPGAQKVVTLSDFLKFAEVTPTRFLVGVARAAAETGDASVLAALSALDLPDDVVLALEELARWLGNDPCNS
jgi:hypothetical protein